MVRPQPLRNMPIPVRVAAFWYRTLAALLDALPVFTIWGLVVLGTGMLDHDLPASRWNAFDQLVDLINLQPLYFVPPILLWFGLLFASYLAQEIVFGVTVGKRVLNLTLVDVHGHRPEGVAILVRNLLRMVSLLLLGLGYWWAAFDTERRTLHDWIAGTWVVHRTEKVPVPRVTPT